MLLGDGLTDYITIPEWTAYNLGGTEFGWSIAYSVFLIGILVFSFEAGRRFLRTTLSGIVRLNTDQLVYAACEKLRLCEPEGTPVGEPAMAAGGVGASGVRDRA